MNLLLTTAALNVYEQMALDEAMVRARPTQITLRFYNWVPGPAVTFGYAQFLHQVHQSVTGVFSGAPLCRRPTGGGVVYHQDDLTFSVVFPTQEKPGEIYRNLHGSIQAALTLSGLNSTIFAQKLPATAYAPSQHQQASTCFTNPVENDLLRNDGQKMLGGAIRRFGSTVLYQGSLQTTGARENPAFKQAITCAVRSFLNADLSIERVADSLLQQARLLAQNQYQTSAWTEKF